MRFLLAYDIANPRRLRRVARVMEKHAIRCQKSVFIAQTDVAGVAEILNQIAPLIDPREDIVQAWRLATDQAAEGLLRGAVTTVFPLCVVQDGGQSLVVNQRRPNGRGQPPPD